MVARIYTPLIPQPTFRPPLGPQGASYADPGVPFEGGEFDTQRQSRGLATVNEQAKSQQISLDTVLQDFRSTMGALRASDPIKNEVEAYLGVVDLQARKETPSVPMIKETLRTAAKSLDGFITQALGQPSRVVGDWVDALLMQNISYKYSDAEASKASSFATPPTDSLMPEPHLNSSAPAGLRESFSEASIITSSEPGAPAFAESDKMALKNCIEASRAYSQAGNYEKAETLLQEGLGLLDGKDRPDLSGKFNNLLGQLYDKTQQPDQAISHYQAALADFQAAKQPQKQAQVLYALGSLYDEKGKLQQASRYYEESLALDKGLGNTRGIGRTLNDLGSAYLRQGQATKAVTALTEAFREANRPEGEKALIPDIFSNLGAAHRSLKQYPKALNAYQVSLNTAVRQRDVQGAVATLQNMASLYLDTDKPDQAISLLQQAESLKKRANAKNLTV